MKKALNLGILRGRNISQQAAIPMIADAGFDGCFWNAEAGISVSRIAQQVRQAGLFMQFIHSPVAGVDKVWQEGPEGDAYMAVLTDWMHQCADADIPWMVCHVWTKYAPVEPGPLGIDRFGRLLEDAEKSGVRIAFENAEVGKFLACIRQQLWSSPAVGFCYDSGHEMCYSDGRDQLALFGDRLLCTHLNDNLGQTGAELTSGDDAHMMPFDGIVDWENVALRLNRCHFRDVLTFELKMQNKPGRHTHDRYEKLQPREILAMAMQKAQQFEILMQSCKDYV